MRVEDVSAKAKVSVYTVSRVVNGLITVSASTRKRVLTALEDFNSRPNLQARALVAGRSNTLGIIVSNLENRFFVDIFHYLEKQAHAAGFEVLAANTNYEPGRLAACIDVFLGRRVAGLAIVVSEQVSPDLVHWQQATIPIAFYDAAVPGDRRTSICFDYRKGVAQLVRHLFDLGHREIAYIGYSRQLGPTDERRDAFVATAKRLKLSYSYLFAREHSNFVAGRDTARELLDSGFSPIGILCVNDVAAIGIIRELRNRKVAVPKSISVAGFDNTELAEFHCPSLTTVNIPRERIANLLFQSLSANDEDASQHPSRFPINPS